MIPTPEQLQKLPKWVQDHILKLSRERQDAIDTLNKFVDSQTKSPVMVEDFACTGESPGPTNKTLYVQTRKLDIVWQRVFMSIILADKHDPQRATGINIHWGSGDQYSSGEAAFIPYGYQSAAIVHPKNLSRIR